LRERGRETDREREEEGEREAPLPQCRDQPCGK